MAKNDEKDTPENEPVEAPSMAAGGKAPERKNLGPAEQESVEDPDVSDPTPAVGTILVDAGAATREQDEELYDGYYGVDEDRKRMPATDAQRPYWNDEELEVFGEGAKQQEEFQRQAEQAQQRDQERRQRLFDRDRA